MLIERELWHVDRYRDLLSVWRELPAQAVNKFLNKLRHGEVPAEPVGTPMLERPVAVAPGSVADEVERTLLARAD